MPDRYDEWLSTEPGSEVAGQMIPAAGELRAALDAIREHNERYIKEARFTEWTVSQDPTGNVRRLLDALDAVLELADKAEHGALRWADPLPVPEWVPRVREAISAKLLPGGQQ
jgi:hypothetical protein